MDLHFKWLVNKGQYQTGESLYLNRISIGSFGWNGSRSRDAEPREPDWVGSLTLPQMSQRVMSDTQEDIKAKLEKMATNWFKEATK